MKILHVLAQMPSKTGSGIYFSNMIKEFKKFNHEQKALFAVDGENNWDILEAKDQYTVNFNTETMPFPIVGMSDIMPYRNTKYGDMTPEMLETWKAHFRKVLTNIKKVFTPDIIIAHHLWILTDMVLEVFEGTKIIGVCHNTDLRQGKMHPSMKEAHVKNLHHVDMVFSASNEQKHEIYDMYAIDREKMVAVGGAFNQDIFYEPAFKAYADTIRLVFCAKIDPSKGIYELIEVYKELPYKHLTLDIIGSPDIKNAEKLASYIAGDASISLYNVRDQVHLGAVLREKDIFLMPSYYEGLGLMAIESLACGLYTVATEIEALMTLLGDEINDSGVIEYVPLPRIYDVDKPVAEDLPIFKENLRSAIDTQIRKIEQQEKIAPAIMKGIKRYGWEGLVRYMNDIILENFPETKA